MRSAVFVLLGVASLATASPELDSAIGLYEAKQFPDARLALEKIVASEPKNAAACYYLGQTLLRRADPKSLDEAAPWLEKATQLDPANAKFLADYGGASLLLAAKNTSVSAATKGRDAMEKSLKLDPTSIDARIGLMQFYQRAPWPLGSSAKAAAQLEEIRKLDPDRATVLSVTTKTAAKDYAAAFKICDEALAKRADDYLALYHYGRTAALSGQNLPRGLSCLQKCAAMPEPGGPSPRHSDVWNRLGNIQEQLAHPAEARTAYETALKLNPANAAAAESLAKLK
ncbi:MAG: tetratricopeptide repeat protein [Opitutaceae bacterium]